MIETIKFGGGFVAYLHQETGEGLLVFPDPRDDVWLPRMGDGAMPADAATIQAADFAAAVKYLAERAWTFSEPDDDTEMFIEVGETDAGRLAVGLYGLGPDIAMPTLNDRIEAGAELREVAGVHLS